MQPGRAISACASLVYISEQSDRQMFLIPSLHKKMTIGHFGINFPTHVLAHSAHIPYMIQKLFAAYQINSD